MASTVRIRMNTSIAGDMTFEEGREYDVTSDVAEDLCERPADYPRAERVVTGADDRQTRPSGRARSRETR